MCYNNYTQHNGCGHIGESHTLPWQLCAAAEQRLLELRGPMSPPLVSPLLPSFVPPKQSHSKLAKRIASFGFTRSATNASSNSRRSVSSPAGGSFSTSTSSLAYTGGGGSSSQIPDYQLAAVICKGDGVARRTLVSSEMEVCKECRRWIGEMRFLIERYEKTGSVKGMAVYDEFLKPRGPLNAYEH